MELPVLERLLRGIMCAGDIDHGDAEILLSSLVNSYNILSDLGSGPVAANDEVSGIPGPVLEIRSHSFSRVVKSESLQSLGVLY